MTAFLRIPPFPGHRAGPIAVSGSGGTLERDDAYRLAGLLREFRVGGSFWAAQPELPSGRDLLLVPGTSDQLHELLEQVQSASLMDRCILLMKSGSAQLPVPLPTIEEPVDPWFLAGAMAEVWASADHEIALVAALTGRVMKIFGSGRFAGCNEGGDALNGTISDVLGRGLSYRCPFTAEPISPIDAIKLLASWRTLIDRNRAIAGVAGVAAWKRATVDPLLWNGRTSARYIRDLPQDSGAISKVVVWKSRTGPALLDRLSRTPAELVEIEDGMIRGPGLGANCVPPLSIVVDGRGIYFDPSAPSDLEEILQSTDIGQELVDRAARLRKRIIETGISKYGIASEHGSRQSDDRRRILVVGQVEDDRSVLTGGAGQTNLELLQRARALEPDAWIIYRPHPDVEAGHRRGRISDALALSDADEIDRESAIATLIDSVDGLHCITSLAGFEALMRGKPVTTHGVPFYAGWGLTRDLADIPARRSRTRTLDELVAATLILYPRYLDPVTRLPCPPEILVERIARGEAAIEAPLAGIRKLQGKLKLALGAFHRSAA